MLLNKPADSFEWKYVSVTLEKVDAGTLPIGSSHRAGVGKR